jgi:hypothetical protein
MKAMLDNVNMYFQVSYLIKQRRNKSCLYNTQVRYDSHSVEGRNIQDMLETDKWHKVGPSTGTITYNKGTIKKSVTSITKHWQTLFAQYFQKAFIDMTRHKSTLNVVFWHPSILHIHVNFFQWSSGRFFFKKREILEFAINKEGHQRTFWHQKIGRFF